MRGNDSTGERTRGGVSRWLGKLMKCLWSEEKLREENRMIPSPESIATKDSVSRYSSRAGSEQKQDTGNIEEAESSLRESGCLNYEEARALLGRYEYQKGNIEAALHVFEGIDITSITPKMKLTLARRGGRRKRRSQSDATPPMSMHAASLLLEAIFLKALSLQGLGRFKEAAQSCKVILDIVESSLPDGLPDDFGADCKLQETLNKAVELLPELYKLADSPSEAISSYRRALLHHWNLETETAAKIQKEFAIFLLYSGGEASPPNLLSQMDSSFVPRNNLEEAILLLMILLRKVTIKKIEWDPSILDHLSYALSVSGELRGLANQVEELLPRTINRTDRYQTLALCYYGEGEGFTALNLLKKLFSFEESSQFVLALLIASKICGENNNLNSAEEGIRFAQKALESLHLKCDQMTSDANFLLGVSLSALSRFAVADTERISRQAEALEALETAARMTKFRDPKILYYLSLENAEQRKLESALHYGKDLLKLEGGSNVNSWLLLARILSARKQFVDAEIIINAALDQTGKWDQGKLLRTNAKLQIAQGRLKGAIETYTQLLAILQVQTKSFWSGKRIYKSSGILDRSLEIATWHDLAYVYISLSQWRDAEVCLSKSKGIDPHSAGRWHATGMLCDAKELNKEAVQAFGNALDLEPNHVPSLISMAVVLRRLGEQSHAIVRSLLTDALRLDRMNPSAWNNLGLLYKAIGPSMSLDAADCFKAAALLEESAPVEPFR